jgi:excinuclease UvrABC ATPase subunit
MTNEWTYQPRTAYPTNKRHRFSALTRWTGYVHCESCGEKLDYQPDSIMDAHQERKECPSCQGKRCAKECLAAIFPSYNAKDEHA